MSTNGTNMRRTAQPDQPMSWNLDATALRVTTATAIKQSACDKGYRVRPSSIGAFVTLATIARRIPDPTIVAANQNRSSSLPIRLDIRCPRVTLASLILLGNCTTVQLHPGGQLLVSRKTGKAHSTRLSSTRHGNQNPRAGTKYRTKLSNR